MFADRESAGRMLAEVVAARLAGQPARIYGLARGGVIVARPIAERLGAPLEVLVACKVGAPLQPELAVGAVAEGGGEFWDRELLTELGLGPRWCEEAARETRAELERRRRRYRARPLAPRRDEVAVVVDDGVATGSTVLAALDGLAALQAERRALATPLASEEALERIRPAVEWIEVLRVPESFGSVGAHYEEFEAVRDEDLMRALGQGTSNV